MTSDERARELLLGYVAERAEKIKADTLESLRGYMESARKSLEFIMEDVEAQAKAFDVVPTMNLIETIASGGFIRSEEREIPQHGVDFRAETGGMRLFENPSDHGWIRLKGGRYRFTLIAERLKEET